MKAGTKSKLPPKDLHSQPVVPHSLLGIVSCPMERGRWTHNMEILLGAISLLHVYTRVFLPHIPRVAYYELNSFAHSTLDTVKYILLTQNTFQLTHKDSSYPIHDTRRFPLTAVCLLQEIAATSTAKSV